ncbi:hypothetical protein SynBIOSE41_04339 [Synechococcus sp. BIOS-E4-1]|nr:hypothetical protein SynBIOSE41_04339 [Synechococcus sp. BIOS-E4-1]
MRGLIAEQGCPLMVRRLSRVWIAWCDARSRECLRLWSAVDTPVGGFNGASNHTFG